MTLRPCGVGVSEIVDLLIRAGIRLVEAMLVIGAIGSVAVILWVGLEDLRMVLKPGDEK